MNKKKLICKEFVFFCLMGAVVSCNDKPKEENTLAVSKVKVLNVGQTTNEVREEYIGTVESSNTVDVSFLSTGTINQLNFSEGQSVSKGQLLATLNTTSLKSAHAVSASSLKQAQDAYKRMNEMYKSQSLPEIKLIEVKTKLEQAESAEIMARKSLNDSYLYAPQSGVISKRYYEKGMNVVMGAPVYTIMNINSVDINIPIPESEISKLQRGQYCDIKVTALNNQGFRGQVIEKGVSADPISHTYSIKVRIANPATSLLPGMVVKAYFEAVSVNGHSGQITIPIRYVLLDYPDKRFVWIVDKNNVAQRKEVVLGNLLGNEVEVLSGLQHGDKIVKEGYQNVSIGNKVSVVN